VIGTRKLNRSLPLPQVITAFDSEKIGFVLLDRLLGGLPDQDFLCLLRLVSMPPDVAVSLIQFFSSEGITERLKHLSLWQQVQFGLRSFCPISTLWSKKDQRTWTQNAFKFNTAVALNKQLPDEIRSSLDILKKRHRVRPIAGEYWKRNFFEKGSIWFLEDKILESLIFSFSSEWALNPVIEDIPEVRADIEVWENSRSKAMAGLADGSFSRVEVLLGCCRKGD
jgi:hypothetical protein